MTTSKHSETKPVEIKLDSFWPYHVVVLADQISRHTVKIAKAEADINISQWRVLAAIADQPGRTAAEVTAITPMDKTIVSRAVSSLIELGLISKSNTAHDKRRQSLMVTKAGQKIYTKVATQLNQALMTELSPNLKSEEFIRTLAAFSSHLSEMSN